MKAISLFEVIRFAEDIKHIVWCFGLGYFLLTGLILNNTSLAFFNLLTFYLLGEIAEQWLVLVVKKIQLTGNG